MAGMEAKHGPARFKQGPWPARAEIMEGRFSPFDIPRPMHRIWASVSHLIIKGLIMGLWLKSPSRPDIFNSRVYKFTYVSQLGWASALISGHDVKRDK